MKEDFKELLKQQGISNLDKPTEADIKKISELLQLLELKINNNELDETIIAEYYKYAAEVLPSTLKTLNDLAAQNLGKDVINSFNKRIDALNKRFETEQDTEVLKLIQTEISDLYERIQNESDKQRTWLKQIAFGALGGAVILGGIAIGVKNKEAGKKIVEEGLKVVKGQESST
ncbi:hypothetical protein [Pseudalkalibacillus hwajinpoensis]|uniref:hypothetical protein n=1 Tax=Guptibacillus hwajinpoensis TaxID=208199 RepID=UPI001CFD0B65|nr:hypothetical protein [Pseudalkalibacillus hwajinpoensis]